MNEQSNTPVTVTAKDPGEAALLLYFRQLPLQQQRCEVARLEGMVAVLADEKKPA